MYKKLLVILAVLLLIGVVDGTNAVVYGDSIARASLLGRLDPLNLTYPNQQGTYGYEFANNYSTYTWYGQGIGGQTTAQQITRWPRDFLGLTYNPGDGLGSSTLDAPPFIAVIDTGTAALIYAEAEATIKSNMLWMANNATENGIPVVFVSIAPTAGESNAEIQSINSWMSTTLPAVDSHIRYYNSYSVLGGGGTTLLPAYDNGDGIHLTPAAYLKMSKDIFDANYDLFNGTPLAPQPFGAWTASGDSFVATNGTHTLRKWTTTGNHTWVTTGNTSLISEYLVLGGGGGAGGANGAGGGAGGFVNGTGLSVSGTVYVNVGAGGAGDAFITRPYNGGNSSFYNIIANGGGSASAFNDAGGAAQDGGSGGGARYGLAGGEGAGNVPARVPAQGFNGSIGTLGTAATGGGGGGAGSLGQSGTFPGAGIGGNGRNSTITGSLVTYGGGGGGGSYVTYSITAGKGGLGGGGNGSTATEITGYAGVNGLGGGGGGGSYRNSDTSHSGGGAGGSGVVIVSYQTTFAPVSSFTANATDGRNPLPVSFTDTTTNTPTSWSWEYNDVAGAGVWTSFGNTQSASNTFAVGNFSIRLITSNAAAFNTSTQKTFVNVSETTLPLANFTADVTSGLFPLTVAFTDLSTNTPTSWNWTLAPGTYSTEQNPTHVYSSGGTYTVSLSIANGDGTDTMTKTGYIEVWNTTTSDFTASVTSGDAPLSTVFTDTSSNATSWYWNFGDGNTSTTKSPSYQYVTVGAFNVNHSASNAHYTNWTNKTGYITTVPTLLSNFTQSASSGTTPLSVTFTDTSTGYPAPSGWNWTYQGYGTNSTSGEFSTTEDTTAVFGTGNFSIKHGIASSEATNISTRISFVNVSPMVANFAANTTLGSYPLSVGFTDESVGSPTAWYWMFGDGGTSVLQNPNYSYAAIGVYTVNFSVTDWEGTQWVNRTNYITVTPENVATQQDVYMASAYNQTFIITDSLTNNPIPVVKLLDTKGDTYDTTIGVGYLTEAYGAYVVYVTSSGYVGKSFSFIADSDETHNIQLTKETSTTGSNLNLLYPHEVRIIVIDTKGVQQGNVFCTAVMMNTTIQGTNWINTLFGISEYATPLNNTLMSGYTDDMGTVVFPMVGSGLYTITFADASRGIATTKTLHPQENTYTFVVPTTRTAPVESSATNINTSVTVVDIAGAVYLNISYTNTRLTTTNVHYFIDYANGTTFYEKNFAGTPATNQSVAFGYPVTNTRGDAYFWGLEAYDTKWGWTNQSNGITMKGVDGMLYNPFIYSDGW